MNKVMHLIAPGYRPLLLTTRTLYPRWRELLWNIRLPERKGLIVVLPRESQKTRECLLAIAREYESRGGSVRMIEEGSGMERYYEVRHRLSAGRR
jgi:hypothetical protein